MFFKELYLDLHDDVGGETQEPRAKSHPDIYREPRNRRLIFLLFSNLESKDNREKLGGL
jgi:hypothetical protein